MANRCDLCDKGRLVGNKVSHSNIKTKMVQRPNLQRVHAKVGGVSRRIRVCTRCLRSGAVEKELLVVFGSQIFFAASRSPH